MGHVIYTVSIEGVLLLQLTILSWLLLVPKCTMCGVWSNSSWLLTDRSALLLQLPSLKLILLVPNTLQVYVWSNSSHCFGWMEDYCFSLKLLLLVPMYSKYAVWSNSSCCFGEGGGGTSRRVFSLLPCLPVEVRRRREGEGTQASPLSHVACQAPEVLAGSSSMRLLF